jgi:hypothetical protein
VPGGDVIVQGTLTLTGGSGASKLTLKTGKKIRVSGNGSISLAHTTFGVGIYAAVTTDDVVIESVTAGPDTITLGATNATDTLTIEGIGLVLGEIATAGTTSAVYSFKSSNSGLKITLDGTNGITVPANGVTGAVGAIFTADAKSAITLGDGSIRVGRGGSAFSGSGCGKLILTDVSTIGVFTDNDGETLAIAEGFHGSDVSTPGEEIDLGSSTSGTIAVSGGKGTMFAIKGTDAAPNAAYSVITAASITD